MGDKLQGKVYKAMGLSKAIERICSDRGLELVKIRNTNSNIGMHPCLVLAIAIKEKYNVTSQSSEECN